MRSPCSSRSGRSVRRHAHLVTLWRSCHARRRGRCWRGGRPGRRLCRRWRGRPPSSSISAWTAGTPPRCTRRCAGRAGGARGGVQAGGIGLAPNTPAVAALLAGTSMTARRAPLRSCPLRTAALSATRPSAGAGSRALLAGPLQAPHCACRDAPSSATGPRDAGCACRLCRRISQLWSITHFLPTGTMRPAPQVQAVRRAQGQE